MTTSRAPGEIVQRAFPGTSPEEVATLVANSQLRSYPAETILCHEKALEETFYLILEGEVEVTRVINDREARLITKFGPGEYFGEMALVQSAPRAATVKALTPLVVLEMDKDAFDRVLRSSSSVSWAMVREIGRRLSENDQMTIDDLRMRTSELALAYRKLAEQEMARREFLANIARQLRTPLIAAGGYLQLIQKAGIPPKNLNIALETISRQVGQIAALVNDILFLQEMDLILGKFEPLDMLEIAHNVADKCTQRARKKSVRVRLEADPGLLPVLGDAKHLERALTVLVDNAVKFSPNGGRVEVRLRKEGEQVVVSVSDQGIGIQSETLQRIFDRFYHRNRSSGQVFGASAWGWRSPNRSSSSIKAGWKYTASRVRAALSRCG
ncbi:MAG: cyclic nucleotide-binding domain-containing protein [Anaerolineales bacterium]|nr:cyclic nucleotide-binding domain-containing protein [Anaerolineales bacterium]